MPFRARLLLLAPLLAGLLACELSTGLISESERRSIYTLGFHFRELPASGDVAAAPGESVQVSLTKLRGAEAAGALFLSLSELSGDAVARISYASASGLSSRLVEGADAETALPVDKLDGLLPAFSLPAELEPGSYVLGARLLGLSGALLQESSIFVHVVPEGFAAGELSVYPPAPAPGAPVLLSIEPRILREGAADDAAAYVLAEPAGGGTGSESALRVFDPWIRWSYGAALIAEGRLSEGADRVAWFSPGVEGAYGISVELFPDPPPSREGSPSLSPWREDGRVVAKIPPKAAVSPFTPASRFHLLYSFDAGLENRGAGAGLDSLRAVGRPRLSAYSGGFGYSLGSESGFRTEGPVWPRVASGERLNLIFRVNADRLEGVLAEFSEPGAGFVLRIGATEGRPYVEASTESGAAFRSVASLDLLPGPLYLQLELRQSEEGLSPLWTASPVGRGLARKARSAVLAGLSLEDLSSGAALSLGGGPQALPGVYDELGIIADEDPPSLHEIAYRDRYEGRLVARADFAEGGGAAEGLSFSGGRGFESGALRLGAGGSVTASGLDPAAAHDLVLDLGQAAKAALRLELLDAEGAVLLALDEEGRAADASGAVLGEAGTGDYLRSSIGIRPAEGGWTLFLGTASLGPFPGAAPAGIRIAAVPVGKSEDGYLELLALSLVADPDRGLAAAPKSPVSLR